MARRVAATVVIACAFVSGAVLAAEPQKCAKPEEMTAMQTAAVQEELMVAALSCNAATLYNAFVTGYQKELQASQKSLQGLFKRLHGSKAGMEEYYSYTTKLANGSSQKSIGNITKFCADAQAAFAAALGPAKSSLSDFVTGHAKTDDDTGVTACEYQDKTMAAMKKVPHIELKKPAGAKADDTAPAEGPAVVQ